MTFEQETDLLCVYLYDLIRENISADGHLLSSSDSDKLQSCAERLSAQDALIEQQAKQIEALREAVDQERERCAALCDWLPVSTGFEGKTFAEAIRGKGLGGELAKGFEDFWRNGVTGHH